MTHKDFLLNVQKLCHLDSSQCTMLLTSLCRLMSQAGVEQVPVTIPGLGTFSSRKHPEYIQEDPQTGQQTLYPPRISYRMSAEDTNVESALLERQLAEHAHASAADCGMFLSAVVQTIYESLSHGEEVEVHGLGVFHNVITHQGELQRVAYMPDEMMRDRVNAPFNCFEPVAIKNQPEDVTVTAVNVTEDASQLVDMPADNDNSITEGADVAAASEAVEDAPVSIDDSADQSTIAKTDLNADAAESPATLVVENDNSADDTEGPAVSVSVEDVNADIADSPAASSPAPAEKANAVSEPSAPTFEDESAQHRDFDDDDDMYMVYNRRKGKRFMAFVLTGVAVLVIAVVLWVVGALNNDDIEYVDAVPVKTQYIEASPNDQSINADMDAIADRDEDEEAEDDVTADSLFAAADAASENNGLASQPASDQLQTTVAAGANTNLMTNPDGSIATYTMQEGDRLTLVALKFYGNKFFWPYIYEVNRDKLTSPGLVQAGMTLKLPDAKAFGIDANDAASVQKAKNKAAELLK